MQLSALDFSEELTQGFAFGIDKERPVATLRRLADMMVSGQVLLQNARVTSFADRDAFTLTGLRLVLAEKIDNGPKTLYGPASKFPVEVVPTDS